ncbi:MAG TPA: GatB/YqeY domain-containing protein [Anaerolineales bacterium]
MDLKTQINDSVKDAMRSGDEVRKRTLRMVMAAIKQVEVDRRTTLDDAGVLSILQKEIKNRREALEEANKAKRADLASENEAEITVLEAFLPQAMPADELILLVEQAVAESGAASMSEMGKVMKLVIPRVAGRAPNDVISAAVRQALQK